jgi:hypothetical protein
LRYEFLVDIFLESLYESALNGGDMHHAIDPHDPPAAAARADVLVPFGAVVLAMLPAVLDQTMLATALPVIAGDLGRLSDVSWVVTAYVVAEA